MVGWREVSSLSLPCDRVSRRMKDEWQEGTEPGDNVKRCTRLPDQARVAREEHAAGHLTTALPQ